MSAVGGPMASTVCRQMMPAVCGNSTEVATPGLWEVRLARSPAPHVTTLGRCEAQPSARSLWEEPRPLHL
jgi:hypothetical protein